jgi:hypothetical protein
VARKLVAGPNTSRAAAAQNPISLPVVPAAARHQKIDAAAANRRPQPRALARPAATAVPCPHPDITVELVAPSPALLALGRLHQPSFPRRPPRTRPWTTFSSSAGGTRWMPSTVAPYCARTTASTRPPTTSANPVILVLASTFRF